MLRRLAEFTTPWLGLYQVGCHEGISYGSFWPFVGVVVKVGNWRAMLSEALNFAWCSLALDF